MNTSNTQSNEATQKDCMSNDRASAGAKTPFHELESGVFEPASVPHQDDGGGFQPFPAECLPGPIRDFVFEGAQSMKCDASLIALPVLAVLASAIGNTARIELKRTFTEPAVLWTVVVAASGGMKTQAMKLALDLLDPWYHKTKTKHEKALLEYADAKDKYDQVITTWEKESRKPDGQPGEKPKHPNKPKRPRCYLQDLTTEALLKVHDENPRGVLVAPDELSRLFDFDRYSNGAGGGDAAMYLSGHNGGRYVCDRVGAGTTEIDPFGISVTGGIQPAILRKRLDSTARENGLAARMLFAMPPQTPFSWSYCDISPSTLKAAQDAVTRLRDEMDFLYTRDPEAPWKLNFEALMVKPNEDALSLYVTFVNQHGQESIAHTGHVGAAWEKYRGLAARLALVIHLTRWACGEVQDQNRKIVDSVSMEHALKLTKWFMHEMLRVYAMLDGGDEHLEALELSGLIKSSGGTITPHALSRQRRKLYPSSKSARNALDDLVQRGWGVWKSSTPQRGGRPSTYFVLTETPTAKVGSETPLGATESGGFRREDPLGKENAPETTRVEENLQAYEPQADDPANHLGEYDACHGDDAA
ncbi:MAG: YfjI family protein [Phycisphaeraceae bacterium]